MKRMHLTILRFLSQGILRLEFVVATDVASQQLLLEVNAQLKFS